MKRKFNFNRFIRSRNGMLAIAGILVVLVIVAVVIGNGGKQVGTVLVVPDYPAPAKGFTCLPTCSETDGKFLVMPGEDVASFGGAEVLLWISVPGKQSSFTLDIFDGDAGKNDSGAAAWNTGNWDARYVELNYQLFADPIKKGATDTLVAQWTSNEMPNNQWFSQTVNQAPEAQSPSGHYAYLLKVTRQGPAIGYNVFKVRSSAYLSTAASLLEEATFGFMGGSATAADFRIIFPNLVSYTNPGSSVYTGEWNFSFYVPNKKTKIEIWDGDFDRGTSAVLSQDTDDPNTDGKPEWATVAAVDERAGGRGAPADNNSGKVLMVRGVPVEYSLIDPAGDPIYTNVDPSGTEEWERFVLSTDGNDNPDMLVGELQPGFYQINVSGLDNNNAVWLRVNYPICDPDEGCGPPEWPEATCPRTIGYWKNNVKKVLIDGKTNGVQESADSLHRAAQFVAQASVLYRSGINLGDPEPIGSAVALSDQELNMILARDKKDYTADSNSMLARALQQNLAAWMNLASGKVGPTTVVTLDVAGGPFEGTILEALQYAEQVILSGDEANMERAKDIGDKINNGLLGEDAASSTCGDYEKVMPKDKQPPSHEDMPKAPKKGEPPVVEVPPAEPICTLPEYTLAGGYAIIALNPEACTGQQNGLLFHGTSLTQIDGTAYSAGCLRSVGTHTVESTAPVDYVGETFGDLTLITAGAQQIATPLPESAWKQAEPNCSDPAAIPMDGKDFKDIVNLDPGLYCISGDVTINAQDIVMGSGVTLYFIDGKLTINGGATVQLTAPGLDASPALPGVLFYVPESNANPVLIAGNSDSYFSGIVYAPASEIEVLGTGYVYGYQAQFVGWDVRVGGTADVILDYQANGAGVCP